MKDIIYTDIDHVEADTNRLIESGSTTERTAARMLKIMAPILKEIIKSGDIACLAGFVRGISQIVAGMVISLPTKEMREGLAEAIRQELEHGLNIAMKGPPKEKVEPGKK
jgi:hypothetical protein